MSRTRRSWNELRNLSPDADPSEVLINRFGILTPKGIDIGLEVTRKIEAKDYPNLSSTVLQAEGLDNGLTAGFMTACGADAEYYEFDYRFAIEALRLNHGALIVAKIVEVVDDLPVTYRDYPGAQQWLMPAVVIDYHEPKS